MRAEQICDTDKNGMSGTDTFLHSVYFLSALFFKIYFYEREGGREGEKMREHGGGQRERERFSSRL